MDDLDRAIIAELQGDIPLEPRPFAAVAERVGTTEGELLGRLRSYLARGWMRRVGAILYHQRAGVRGNVMCAWRVPADRVDEVGKTMASFRAVSHCYLRPAHPRWPYNVYTMVHGRDRGECERVIGEIARATGISDYRPLFTTREFKKTSMEDF